MANSAITFNTAGLASATSPGLVGTGAQTFAGKKTLDGGAAIKGDNGSALIASSYVGQVIAAHKTTNTNLTSSAWTSITSITINAGIWSVSGAYSINRNGASLTIFNLAAAVMANTNEYGSIYSFRGAFQENKNASSSSDEYAGCVGPLLIRSDGTNLYLSDGTLLTSSPSQVLQLFVYIGQFATNTPICKGRVEAIRIA